MNKHANDGQDSFREEFVILELFKNVFFFSGDRNYYVSEVKMNIKIFVPFSEDIK